MVDVIYTGHRTEREGGVLLGCLRTKRRAVLQVMRREILTMTMVPDTPFSSTSISSTSAVVGCIVEDRSALAFDHVAR